MRVSGKPRILFVTDSRTPALPVPDDLANAFQIVEVENPLQAISLLSSEPAAGILFDSDHLRDAQSIERILGNERILEAIPDGVALLDLDNRIVWANERFCKWAESEDVVDENFYRALGGPEIIGPDFCPLSTTLGTGVPSTTMLKVDETLYCQVHAASIQESAGTARHVIVTLSDVTEAVSYTHLTLPTKA